MFNDLLGAMMESGMTRPSGRRVQHALRAGGTPSEGAIGSGETHRRCFGGAVSILKCEED